MTLLELIIMQDDRLRVVIESIENPSDRDIFIEICKLPPLELIEDVLNYKYYRKYKVVLFQRMNHLNYGIWMKHLTTGIDTELVVKLLKS